MWLDQQPVSCPVYFQCGLKPTPSPLGHMLIPELLITVNSCTCSTDASDATLKKHHLPAPRLGYTKKLHTMVNQGSKTKSIIGQCNCKLYLKSGINLPILFPFCHILYFDQTHIYLRHSIQQPNFPAQPDPGFKSQSGLKLSPEHLTFPETN